MGFEIFGLGLQRQDAQVATGLPPHVSVINADICDYASLRQILRDVQPDQVYHLAAISNVAESVTSPRPTYKINVGGTLNLLEALRELNIRPRILHVSTAHIYASVNSTSIDETSPLSTVTPYAASKFMSETLATQYATGYGFPVMIVRPFNHVGPGQSPGFVCSDFARQIAAIKLGQVDPILRVGNLAPVRDFTDVRDMVQAYGVIAAHGTPGEIYNVSSGYSVSIQEIVSLLCELAEVHPRIEVDQEKFRPLETLCLMGNSAKVRALGWKPRIQLKQTLRDILDYWLASLKSSTEDLGSTQVGSTGP